MWSYARKMNKGTPIGLAESRALFPTLLGKQCPFFEDRWFDNGPLQNICDNIVFDSGARLKSQNKHPNLFGYTPKPDEETREIYRALLVRSRSS